MRFSGVLDTGRKILTANVCHGTSGNAQTHITSRLKLAGPLAPKSEYRGAGLSEKIKTILKKDQPPPQPSFEQIQAALHLTGYNGRRC